MKSLLTILLLFTLAFNISASEEVELQEANIDLSDTDSLQRGAQHFVTYCLGCHSAKHIRYLRFALDSLLETNGVCHHVIQLDC